MVPVLRLRRSVERLPTLRRGRVVPVVLRGRRRRRERRRSSQGRGRRVVDTGRDVGATPTRDEPRAAAHDPHSRRVGRRGPRRVDARGGVRERGDRPRRRPGMDGRGGGGRSSARGRRRMASRHEGGGRAQGPTEDEVDRHPDEVPLSHAGRSVQDGDKEGDGQAQDGEVSQGHREAAVHDAQKSAQNPRGVAAAGRHLRRTSPAGGGDPAADGAVQPPEPLRRTIRTGGVRPSSPERRGWDLGRRAGGRRRRDARRRDSLVRGVVFVLPGRLQRRPPAAPVVHQVRPPGPHEGDLQYGPRRVRQGVGPEPRRGAGGGRGVVHGVARRAADATRETRRVRRRRRQRGIAEG
mmetsp:Transcript_13336/g.28838  ORF Transcript_13336/g.28838 Transcript_13336/m.28838 type:complete len:351 (-) Transcript_13336:172-1224(-)